MRFTTIASSLFLLATFVVTSSVSAANFYFQANLDGLQEVPPNASPAYGLVDLTLDDTTGAWTITTGTYQDLLGGINGAAIHGPANPGVNAAIITNLTMDTPGAATGTVSGNGVFTPSQVLDLQAEKYYVNLRSSVFPSGEIRGQLLLVPEPSTFVLAGFGIVGFGVLKLRRRKAA
jgi:hypothetical protein